MIAVKRKLAGALGIALALPFALSPGSLLASASPHGDIEAAMASASTEFDRWRDYALASITPRFSWASTPAPADVMPRVTDAFDSARPASFSTSLSIGDGNTARLGISVATGAVSDTPGRSASSIQNLIETPQLGLHRSVVTPTLSLIPSENTHVGVSAVLAYQRFASMGMGIAGWETGQRPTSWASRDTSFGTGVRLDTSQRITPQLTISGSYQSRVNMDPFASYRGVYADRGDFDIPAQAGVGISYALTPALSADIGVDRLGYSEIKPFTSMGLPIRLLALLGDGLSPNFVWRDLTVYSAGWSWRNSLLGEFRFRYTTRQQPLPTSRMLAQALEDDISRYTMSMGWARPTSRNSRLAIVANYASSAYLFGMPSYLSQRGSKIDRLEYQALWSLAF